ncbi:hypothetical protein ISCGN_009675 [Ixodes scapularis]
MKWDLILEKFREMNAALGLKAGTQPQDMQNRGDLGEGAGAAAAGLSLEGGAARLLPPGAGGSSRCSCRGAGALQSAAKISRETWVALDSERGAGPLRTTSAKLPFDKKENRFLASGTPVYEKRGPKWCIASPGGPRRVQPCPGLSSTTRMPFSPDTGKPRTVRRGRANPHGSGSVETPLSKHLLSQFGGGAMGTAPEVDADEEASTLRFGGSATGTAPEEGGPNRRRESSEDVCVPVDTIDRAGPLCTAWE